MSHDHTAPATPELMQRFNDLRLGQQVQVQVASGLLLRNNETGGHFAPDTSTPQTVTTTLLRRLQDGDLVLIIGA